MGRSDVIDRLRKLAADADGEPVNYTSFPLEEFDQYIKKESQNSSRAPGEFLEAELRRDVNRWLLNSSKMYSGAEAIRLYSDSAIFKIRKFEEEYQCYFNPPAYAATLTDLIFNPDNLILTAFLDESKPDPRYPDQPAPLSEMGVQIFGCIDDNVRKELAAYGVPSALRTLGFTTRADPVWEVRSEELPQLAKRYLIAIGCLYPQDEMVRCHPNMLWGYYFMRRPGLIPTLEFEGLALAQEYIKKYQQKILRTDTELWDYFAYLLCFQVGGFKKLLAETWRQTGKALERGDEDVKLDPISIDAMDQYVELGRRFVPQRYLELEPKIEKFEWFFPEVVNLA